MNTLKEKLLEFIDQNCLITSSSHTLSIGTQSSFYFDCKKATLDGECLDLIAQEFLIEIDKLPEKPTSIGGLTLGADFIVSAVILKAYQNNQPTIKGSIVRKDSKKHGTCNSIENELPEGTKIVVVDDVITTGNSTAIACNKFLEANYKIVGILALVDREAGGKEYLESSFDCPVYSVFKKADFERLTSNSKRKNRDTRDSYPVWIDIHKQEPELKYKSVLMRFENGSIDIVNIEDFFKPIPAGFRNGEMINKVYSQMLDIMNSKNNHSCLVEQDSLVTQQYTKWWKCHEPACTHWMYLAKFP